MLLNKNYIPIRERSLPNMELGDKTKITSIDFDSFKFHKHFPKWSTLCYHFFARRNWKCFHTHRIVKRGTLDLTHNRDQQVRVYWYGRQRTGDEYIYFFGQNLRFQFSWVMWSVCTGVRSDASNLFPWRSNVWVYFNNKKNAQSSQRRLILSSTLCIPSGRGCTEAYNNRREISECEISISLDHHCGGFYVAKDIFCTHRETQRSNIPHIFEMSNR